MPLHRVRNDLTLGSATIDDVVRIEAEEDRLYELVDGVLLEKSIGYYESILAMRLAKLMSVFVDEHQLGIVAGEAGMMRVLPDQVRIPDVSFVTWQRFEHTKLERTPVPAISPDLAVEILSDGNTAEEMERKLQDYFSGGTRLVWHVDPKQKSVHVFSAPENKTILTETDVLTGGEVQPGFEVELESFFAPLEPPAKP